MILNQQTVSGAARTLVEGDIWLSVNATNGTINILRYDAANTQFDEILKHSNTVATGGYVMNALNHKLKEHLLLVLTGLILT